MIRNLYSKLVLVIAFFMFVQGSNLFSQINFTFTSVAGTYTANASPATIHAAAVDDALSAAINIGFTFNYECVDYTQIKVSSNGWLTFNTAITSSNVTNNLETSSDRPIIAPLWDDLQVYTGGTVNYQLTGSSPSRVLTVEWKTMEWDYGASGNVISFQVKLYETTHATTPNRIEFIYTPGATGVSTPSASIGLSGSASGDFYSLDGTGASPTASKVTETKTLSVKPSDGRIYRWDPVACCTPPTTQATSFSSSAITSGSMTVGWTRGNGDNVMVIARAGSAPTDPTNGTSYTANNAYGSGTAVGGGFCVYNGTGISENITALTSSTTYYFAVYEYNTTGTCYNLIQLTGSATTLDCFPSSQATVFTSSAITSTTMTIGWTRGNGNNVMVIAKAGSAPTDPASGTSYTANSVYGSGTAVGGGFCVYNGSGTSVNITGLSQITTYYFAIYEYNTTGTCYRLTELTGNATTACSSAITFPFSESFDGATFPPTCWLNTQVSGTGLWARSTSGTNPTCSPHSGAGMGYFNSYSYSTGTASNLVTPPLPLEAGSCYTVSFWFYGVSFRYDELDVYVNTVGNATGGTSLGNIYLNDYSGWTQITYDIPVSYSGSNAFIIFQGISDFDYNIFIDDVLIAEKTIPVCTTFLSPTNGATGICNAGTTLTWNTVSGAEEYKVYFDNNASPATLVSTQAGTTYATGALTAGTTYYWKIIPTNCAGDAVGCTTVWSFTALTQSYASLPYSQGFEGPWIDRCDTREAPDAYWTNTPKTGDRSWRRDDDGVAAAGWSSADGLYSPVSSVGSYSANFNSYDAADGTIGSLDLFVNMSPSGTKTLFFDYINPGTATANDKMEVLLSTNGGLTFPTTLLSLPAPIISWTTQSVDISSTSSTCVIRFLATSDYGSSGENTGIDNLNLVLPCSGTPTAGTASATNLSFCNTSSPLLTLTGYTIAGGIVFQWQSSVSNSPYAWTNITNGTTTVFSAPEISQTTYYRCEVRCGSNTAYSNILAITNTAQSITSTNDPVSIVCGNTANLTATASGGASVKWYSALTGGTVLFTGSPFTTPAISANTTYYCDALSGASSENGGMPTPSSTSGYLDYGLGVVFTATGAFTLTSVTVYPKGTGTVTIQLQNSSGTPLFTTAATAVSGTGTTPNVISLGWAVGIGADYRLVMTTYTGITDLIRDFSASFPYSSPSGNLVVTSGYWTGTTSTNYYMYNLEISIGCESTPRTPVNITVTGVTAPVASAYTAPANGSTGICPVSTTLSWAASNTACRAATSYKLYFGTNNPPTNLINGTDIGNVLSYNLGTLSGSTLYYWRIIPTNAGGDATGFATWSFTTAANPGSICPGLLGTGVTNVASLPYSAGAGSTSGGINDLTSGNLVSCGSTSYFTGEDKVWYFTPSTSGSITINLTSTGSYTGLMLYDGCPLSAGACGAAPGSCTAYSQSSTGNKTMSACVAAGITYYLILDSWSSPSSNSFSNLTISAPSGVLVPPNDLPCNATSIVLGSITNGDNSCAGSSSEPASPGCWINGVINTVWYSVVAPASGQLSIKANTNGLTDTQIGLFQGSCSALTQVSPTSSSCNNDISGCGSTMSSKITVTGLTPGNTYYIVVDGVDDLTGTFNIQAIDPTTQTFPVTPGQDCSLSLPTCNAILDVGDPGYANTGTECDFTGTGNCTSGERASVWYTIDIGATGSLLFDIIPNDTNGTVGSETDYDFLIWKTAGSGTITNCATIASNSAQGLVACNFSSLGITGLYTGGAGNPAYNGGTPWDGAYEVPVSATLGDQYVIVVQNYTQSTSGFSIDYSGSAGVINISPVPTLEAWTGATSTAWNNSDNWGGCGAPNTCATSVVIPGYMSTMPSISSNTLVKDLTVNPGGTLTIDASQKLSVCGNFVNNGSISFGAGAILEFIGTIPQTFTSSTLLTIPNVIINNSAGVTLTGGTTSNITVTGTLTLTAGKLFTSDPPLIIMDAGSTLAGGSATCFVDGPMQKVGNTSFTFPLGDGTKWARLGISAPTVSSTFQAQYFANANGSTTPMDLTQGAANLNHVSVVEYWQLDHKAGAGTTSVTLYWENAGSSGINECGSSDYLSVAKWTGSAWTNLNTSGGAYTGACNGAVSGTITTEADVTTFSPFTFGTKRTPAQNPLPLELLSFIGENAGNENVLDWKTSSELNNDFFTLERSANGLEFYELSKIKGAGNSNEIISYRYLDRKLNDPKNYYRLRQTDFDGSEKYTKTIVILNGKSSSDYIVLPNPTSKEIFIYSIKNREENVKIEITDISGRAVLQEKQFLIGANGAGLPIDISNFSEGIYFIAIRDFEANPVSFKKFVKMK